MTGGCACGAVRYTLSSAPFDAGWCHCRTCQLNSGSPAMAFAAVAVDDFVFEKGAGVVGMFKSSDFGHRAFCMECGTPLYMRVTDEPATLDFSIATLDDPAAVPPGFHIFTDSALPWAKIADGLPRYPRARSERNAL